MDIDAECCFIVHPNAVGIGTFNNELVHAGRELAEGDARNVSYVGPFTAVHAVGILHQIVVFVVQCGEVDSKLALTLVGNVQLSAVQQWQLLLFTLIEYTGEDD